MSGRADVVHGTKTSPEPGSDVGPVSEQGPLMRTPWALIDELTLGALPTAVASARLHARMLMDEWAMPDLADDVALVVSELVTNAVVASTRANGRPTYVSASGGLPVVHLRLMAYHKQVMIEVWDLSSATPDAKEPDLEAEGGRGLFLVEALTERWGWAHVPDWPGKVVWAEFQAG